ncbi:hypothetical protein GCM10010306_104180 [Streptomyces umbrinus]|nr:hypothetical protein GCM10010306_104180 [Streptomyces umbrinus]
MHGAGQGEGDGFFLIGADRPFMGVGRCDGPPHQFGCDFLQFRLAQMPLLSAECNQPGYLDRLGNKPSTRSIRGEEFLHQRHDNARGKSSADGRSIHVSP